MKGKIQAESIINLIIAYKFAEAEDKLHRLVGDIKHLPERQRQDFILDFGEELKQVLEIGLQGEVISVLIRTLFR